MTVRELKDALDRVTETREDGVANDVYIARDGDCGSLLIDAAVVDGDGDVRLYAKDISGTPVPEGPVVAILHKDEE